MPVGEPGDVLGHDQTDVTVFLNTGLYSSRYSSRPMSCLALAREEVADGMPVDPSDPNGNPWS